MSNVFTKSDGFKSEYSCAVVRVGELIPVEGSDFLAKTQVFGTQIVVRKDEIKEGDVMIYAANETQLNERFLSVNNLFEIGCREKNANAEEVQAIMKAYEPIKEEADRYRQEAKSLKAKIDKATGNAAKFNKKAAKMKAKLANMEEGSDEYLIVKGDMENALAKAEKCTADAMANTTPYTNAKNKAKEITDTGADIIAEAKKHCGFFNKYGRVRCIVLKGEPSFGFLFKPENLRLFDSSIMLSDVDNYVDQEFDTVNGELFVKAYVPPVKERPERGSRAGKAQKKLNRFDRMVEGEFNFHYTTDQFQKMVTLFKPEDKVDISVKQHGTSIVIGKLHVKEPIKLPFFKRLFNKFIDWTGLFKSHKVIDYKIVYGPVYSSRTVIKNKYINKDVNGGFYGKDIWSEYGDIIYPYLDEGMTVYGEICGYLTDTETPIQKTYDYGCDKGENTIMFYRITTPVEVDGEVKLREWEVQEVFEWTEKLKERMYQNGDPLNAVRVQPINVLYHGTLEDLYPDLDPENHWAANLLDMMKHDKKRFGMEENEPLCTHHQVPREGICIRKCGSTKPACYKLKTDAFFLGESVRMDAGEVDIEMADNYGDEPETV